MTVATPDSGTPEPQTIVHSARTNREARITVRDVDFWYGDVHALKGITLDIYPAEIIAFMGPSGCGKTTLLKLFNRMQEVTAGTRMTGRITLDGADIHDPQVDPPILRRRFGWVAQKPNPFATSIRENVAYGARLHAVREEGREMDAHVEDCLTRAHLWDEVKDRLDDPGLSLSGGQQQRLCIARALSVDPEVLLMDEPCSSIDPIATAKIEELMRGLGRDISVVIITHNLQQAKRVADRVAFFHLGRIVEVGPTDEVFGRPAHEMTRRYLEGAFG